MYQSAISAKPWWKRWWGMVFIFSGVLIVSFFTYVVLLMREGVGRESALRGHFSTTSQTGVLPSVVDPERLIRPASPSLGSPTAPITIVEFADFECPNSEESFPVIRTLLNDYGKDIYFVYRQFPLPTLHEHAQAAAEASVCAAAQGKFWAYHDRLFLNQNSLDDQSLQQYALQAGLDSDEFSRCFSTHAGRPTVATDLADGRALGVRGTPTWFINGRKVEGAIPEDIFRKVIEELL